MTEAEQTDLFAEAVARAIRPPALLLREELPELVWKIDALMAGRRQPRDDVEADFFAYHTANPRVFWLFDQYARVAIEKGRKTYSAWIIMNRLRWDIEMEASDPNSEFKIANDYFSLYARWWMERHPEHLDFFETKWRKVELVTIEGLGRIPESRTAGMTRRGVL